MSLDWKLQRYLDNRPHDLMLFLSISLLLHGIVYLGIENHWRRSANQSLRTNPDAPIPVEYIEVPPDKVAVTPPSNTKQKASTNSRSEGEARPELPITTGAFEARPTAPLPASQPSLTQSKPSTPQANQANNPPQKPSTPQPNQANKLPQQPQSAPRRDPLPPTSSKPNSSPSVAQMPTPESSSRPPQRQNTELSGSPVNPTNRELINALRNNPSTPQPSQPKKPPQQPQPALRRDLLPLTSSKPNSSPPLAQMPTPEFSPKSPQRQNASLPGGPVNPTSRKFMGDLRNNPSTPQPSQAKKPPKQSQSALRRDPLPTTSGKPNSSPPVARMPVPESSSKQPPRQNASLLGGSVNLGSRELTGDRRGIPNANRLALDSTGVDARQDLNLGPYLDTLRQQVEKQWRPEVSNSSKQTIIGFSVSRTGQVTALRILQPSDSNLIDQAALKAVQRAAPFKPLPEGYRPDQLEINFTFNINVYGELKPKNGQ